MKCAGQAMEDGKGVLEDGTRYMRESGEDFGPNGFWKRWTRLAGVSAAGKVRPALNAMLRCCSSEGCCSSPESFPPHHSLLALLLSPLHGR